MMTGIWKVALQAGKMDEFMDAYVLFKQAPGFISCQFYPVVGASNEIIAVEQWESVETQKNFMKSLPQEEMGKIFSLLAGKPEIWNCEIGDLVKG